MEAPLQWVSRPCTSTTDAVPPSIGGYSFTALQLGNTQAALLFGGCDAFGVAQNAVYLLNVCDWRWSLLQPTDSTQGPSQRLSHSTTVVTSTTTTTSEKETEDVSVVELIVFGGMRAVPDEEVFGDLSRLRVTRTMVSQRRAGVTTMHPTWTLDWTDVTATGTAPCPRHSHAAAAVHGGKSLLVVGGSTASQEPLGDVFLLQTQHGVWQQLQVSILPREMASAVSRCNPEHPEEGDEIIIAGGRTTGGRLLGDSVVLQLHPLSHKTSENIVQSMTLGNGFSLGRCNHQLALLGRSKTVLMAVGGLDPLLQTGAASGESDELMCLPEELGEGSLQRSVGRWERPLIMMGFGHGLCHFEESGKESGERVLVGSGIVPNKVGASLEVFELCRKRSSI